MKTIRLSIIGFGAVGQGIANALLQKQEYLESAGLNLKVVAISDSHYVKSFGSLETIQISC